MAWKFRVSFDQHDEVSDVELADGTHPGYSILDAAHPLEDVIASDCAMQIVKTKKYPNTCVKTPDGRVFCW